MLYQVQVKTDNQYAYRKLSIKMRSSEALKQAKLISEAKKYGSGVLSVVNGNDVLEQICF